MSDKKEIHVKDLVIKADNVVFEQREKHHPFFSPRNQHDRHDVDDEKHEKEEAAHDDYEKHEEDDHDHHRPPFFWI